MNYSNAHSPTYTVNGSINLFVTFEGIGEVPFTASSADTEAHGREIFARAVAGEFGAVSPYVVSAGQRENEVLEEQARKLAEIDAVATNPIRWNALSSEDQAACAEYRSLLTLIPQQAGFPFNISWPVCPITI